MAAPIKLGGFKLSLAGAKSKAALRNPPTNPAKRPRLALGDDEPEETNQQQEISGFDIAQGGAVELNGKKKEKEVLRVIPSLPNHDWRDEARRRHAERTGHGQQVDAGTEHVEENKIQYGLTLAKKDPRTEDESADVPVEDAKPVQVDDGLTPEQRLEQRAIDALLNGKAPTDQTTIPIRSDAEVFAQDLADAPDAPSLDAYEATPIEGFGAALLRGMGWKDGEELGRNKHQPVKLREVKPRPALLGIGAKEGKEVGLEQTWEKGKPKRKAAQTYNPVALRNKITGEVVTEEELRQKLEKQKLDEVRERKESRLKRFEFDDEARSEKRAQGSDRRKDDRRRDRDRDRDDKYGYSSERRHKGRSRTDRRRDDDDDEDDDRRREKQRDRRFRSRSPDAKRSRDKRRDRSQSRDPEDRRDRDKRRERQRRDDSRDRGARDSEDSRKRRRDHHHDDERNERHSKTQRLVAGLG